MIDILFVVAFLQNQSMLEEQLYFVAPHCKVVLSVSTTKSDTDAAKPFSTSETNKMHFDSTKIFVFQLINTHYKFPQPYATTIHNVEHKFTKTKPNKIFNLIYIKLQFKKKKREREINYQ